MKNLLKQAWSAAANLFKTEDPKTVMLIDDVLAINLIVQDKTGLTLACNDMRDGKHWRDIGVSAAKTVSDDVIKQAEDIVVAEATARGVTIAREDIARYEPTILPFPSFSHRPTPQKW